ncbi:MAG: hypothetical protein WBF13_04400 [Candidatus Zixiibacteriota bacterium]
MRNLTISCLVFLVVSGVSLARAETAGKSLVRLNSRSDGMLLSQQERSRLANPGGTSLPAHYYASEEPDDFFQMPGEFEEKKEGLKSTTKAALLSLILPGAGEIYGGSKTKGKIFILSEASLWAGFFAFRTYGAWLEDDYRVYAAARAKVNLEGKSEGFFDQLAFYDSRDQYNQFAPLYYRGERQPYPEDDFWYWAWDSRESRAHYRDLKNRSKDASRKALYMVGLSLVNRIVSVVDAMKTVRSYNRRKSLELSRMKFDLKANPLGHNPKVMLYVSHNW